MSTPAQLTANRANAQLSTGPVTPEGIAASKLNALKHGLTSAQAVLPSEDPAAYEALRAGYIETYAPANEEEAMLVEQLTVSWWKLLRAQRIEVRVMQQLGEEACFLDEAAARKWNNFIRHRNAVERAWRHAHTALEKMAVQRRRDRSLRAERAAVIADMQARRDANRELARREPNHPFRRNGFVLPDRAKARATGRR